MAEHPEVRIGTAEREEAVSLLGDHFAQGRLSLDEFDERVALATQARTRGDLVPLFTDLPTAPAVLAVPESRNVAADLVVLVPFALAALALLVVIRHPLAILAAFAVLYFVGLRGYRIVTGRDSP